MCIRDRVQELQGELDGVGEDDPRRATLEAKIAKAKAVWEGYATRKEELEPVSYTHLDVYKRQVSFIPSMIPRA